MTAAPRLTVGLLHSHGAPLICLNSRSRVFSPISSISCSQKLDTWACYHTSGWHCPMSSSIPTRDRFGPDVCPDCKGEIRMSYSCPKREVSAVRRAFPALEICELPNEPNLILSFQQVVRFDEPNFCGPNEPSPISGHPQLEAPTSRLLN